MGRRPRNRRVRLASLDERLSDREERKLGVTVGELLAPDDHEAWSALLLLWEGRGTDEEQMDAAWLLAARFDASPLLTSEWKPTRRDEPGTR